MLWWAFNSLYNWSYNRTTHYWLHWMTSLPSSVIFDYLIWDKGFVSHWQRYSIISSETKGFVGLINCPPSSMVVPMVTATKRRKVFFFIFYFFYVSWDFPPHLLCSGGAGCVVATWCDLRGVNLMLHSVRLSVFLLFFSFLCLAF